MGLDRTEKRWLAVGLALVAVFVVGLMWPSPAPPVERSRVAVVADSAGRAIYARDSLALDSMLRGIEAGVVRLEDAAAEVAAGAAAVERSHERILRLDAELPRALRLLPADSLADRMGDACRARGACPGAD